MMNGGVRVNSGSRGWLDVVLMLGLDVGPWL
jgi:hypothetical protein